MDWEPHWQWWRRMIQAPEPDPAKMAALLGQARELYTQFRQRAVNLALRHTGIKVTLGGEKGP